MARGTATAWGLGFLALAGCQSSAPNTIVEPPAVLAPIPVLESLPYCFYVIESGSGAIDRISIDGARRTRITGSPPHASDSGELPMRFNPQPNLLSVGGVPQASVSVDGAFWGRGTLTLQEPHTTQNAYKAGPPWERLGIDPPPKKPNAPGSTGPSVYDSPWAIRYQMRMALVQGREMSVVSEIKLRHRDGIRRAYRFSANDGVPVQVVGIFASRYLAIHDNPRLVLWDLETDAKRELARCSDVQLAWYVPKLNDMRPRARIKIGSDAYEWSLRNPDDLNPEPQFQVRTPSQ